MSLTVFDASAVIAFLGEEPGKDTVKDALQHGSISSVNWSEVIQKLLFHGRSSLKMVETVPQLGLSIEPLTREDAEHAADLYEHTRSAGLSLADRCCLALAHRLKAPVLTANRAWSELDLSIEIQQIR